MASNSPAYDAAQILINAGIVAASGNTWPVKLGRLMTSPDAQVAIVDTPGRAPNPKWLLDEPSLMVLIRGNIDGYAEAWAKGKAIKDKILGMDPVNLTTGDRWNGVLALSDLAFLAYDANSRPTFSINFRLIIEPAASNSPLSNRASL